MLLRKDISGPCVGGPFLKVPRAPPWKSYIISERALSIFHYISSIVVMYTHEHHSYLIIIIFALDISIVSLDFLI